jgi:hypothetical protein
MEYIALDAHKHCTVASVARPTGVSFRRPCVTMVPKDMRAGPSRIATGAPCAATALTAG